MARYTYTFEDDALPNVTNLIIREGGGVVCGQGKLITIGLIPNFEAISVPATKRGRGLSYAITYLLMLRAKELNYNQVQVSDAHGPLINSLQRHGFIVTHDRHMLHPPAATLRCNNVTNGLARCKSIMVQKGLISDGFRVV